MLTYQEALSKFPSGKHRDAIRFFTAAPTRSGKPSSVGALARALGYAVEFVDMPLNQSGKLVRDGFSDSGWSIQINAKHSRVRQRWTLLHELAHSVLHHSEHDPFAENDRVGSFYADIRREREADEFVALLVFGNGALQRLSSREGCEPAKLSKILGFSEDAVKIGLRQFT